jgi:hypothetical protein
VIKSAPEQIEALRKMANNRFISANHAGLYGDAPAQVRTGGRNFNE